jgi:iron-regulated transporter 1
MDGCVYVKVLTFGGMMTAYLVSCNMSLSTIGIWHGVSSVIGLLGTVVFTQSQKYHMTLESTALWGIVWDFLCLSIALSSIFVVSKDDLSARLLIAGVLPSRIGLFVYDISVTQLFQKTVPTKFRGQVGGTQIFLNSFFGYLLFVLGMIYSDVQNFWILIVVGYVSIGVAMIFYFLGAYRPYKNGYSDLRPLDDDDDNDDEDRLGDVELIVD